LKNPGLKDHEKSRAGEKFVPCEPRFGGYTSTTLGRASHLAAG